MAKVCIFNKSNDVSRFNIFEKFEISPTCCTMKGAVCQNVLDSERRLTDLTLRLIECNAADQMAPVSRLWLGWTSA